MNDRVFLYPEAGPGGRNYLRQLGTREDIKRLGIKLIEGKQLSFYCDDANDQGDRDDLYFEGTAHLDSESGQWYFLILENTYRQASKKCEAEVAGQQVAE